MKYISSQNGIVIFSGGMSHREVAESLKRTYFGEVESAGFVHGLGEGDLEKITTVGESISLDLKSKPEDAQKIIIELRGFY